MVKIGRLLLLLLVMLLPLRGTLAAVAHCPGSSDGPPAVAVGNQCHPHHGGHASLCCDTSNLAQQPVDPHDHANGVPDPCNLCTASCSTTPIMPTMPSLASPVAFAAVAFPAVHAPPANHSSQGPERPPRSL